MCMIKYYPIMLMVLVTFSCATMGPQPEAASQALEAQEQESQRAAEEDKKSEEDFESEARRDLAPREERESLENDDQASSGIAQDEPAPSASLAEILDLEDDYALDFSGLEPTDGANYTVHLPEAKTLLDEMVSILQKPQKTLSEAELAYFREKLGEISGQFYWVPQKFPGQAGPATEADWAQLRSAPWYEKARWEGSGLEGFMDEGGARRLRIYQSVLGQGEGFMGAVLITL
jgi:hypothetical protein